MTRKMPRENLAKNLAALMERANNMKQTALARKSGVSQRTISNLLNPKGHSPSLESIESVAAAFGLEGWHLILPNLIDDIDSGASFAKVFNAYYQATPDGKRHIQRVAEREAEYGRTGSDD